MFHRKLKYSVILSLLALSIIIAGIIFHSQKNNGLKVVFLDVGQGDAILFSEGNYQMLVDGGRDGKLLLGKLGKYVPFWDRNIEVMLATHPDQDHIAGLIGVLESYNVKTVIKNSDKNDTQTYRRFQDDIAKEKSENIEAKRGVKIKFPSGTEAEIVYPFSETGDLPDNQSNSGSVVVKITSGKESFLLTGDLPKDKEKEIMDSGLDIGSKFLKISHHGSKYSTSAEFLDKINPDDAIVSVGKDNSYGHPNQEVLDLLRNKGVDILRTDEKGDIIFECKENLDCQIK